LLIPWEAVRAAYRQTPQDRRIKLVVAADRDIPIALRYRLFESVTSLLTPIQPGSTAMFQWRSIVVGLTLMLLAWGGLSLFVW
jgi:hypothetical protein